jgi:ketopantoate reductase
MEGDLEMNTLLEGLKAGKEKICVVGLGYVGLPLAVSLAEHFKVVGFDKNSKRVEALRQGIDYTGEAENREKLLNPNLSFTDDPSAIRECKFIIAVRHRVFLETFTLEGLKRLSCEPSILFDIKGVFERKDAEEMGFIYWRL